MRTLFFLSFTFTMLLFSQIVLAGESNHMERVPKEKSVMSTEEKTDKSVKQDGEVEVESLKHPLPLGGILLLLLEELPEEGKLFHSQIPARALIGPEGGTLVAFGSKGRVFRLTIPPHVINGPEVLISMEPLESTLGLPISGAPLAGVEFEPAGLDFDAPVTLEVRLQQPHKKSEVLAVSSGGNGDNPFFVPLIINEPQVQELSLQLNHFSTLWVGTGDANDIPKHHLPPEYIDRLSQMLAEWAAYKAAEMVSEEKYSAAIIILLESYFDEQVLPLFEHSHYNCKLLGDMPQRLARWMGFTSVFATDLVRENGLTKIRATIPLKAKETLNEEVSSLGETCRKLEPSCETEELIQQVALCDEHAEYLSSLIGKDLRIDLTLTDFCPGKPAAIRIDPKRYSVCTGKSFSFKGWVEDAGGTFLDARDFPITYTSTNELIMSVGANWTVKGLRPGEAALLATAGCNLATRHPIRVGVVNLVGHWTLSGKETVTNCMDPSDNDVYKGTGLVTIDWQYENGEGLAFFAGKIGGQDFNGTVNCSGDVEGEGFYIHEDEGLCWDDGWVECDVEGHDVLEGNVTSSTGHSVGEGVAKRIKVTTESVDIIGDTCTSKGEGVMSRPYSFSW